MKQLGKILPKELKIGVLIPSGGMWEPQFGQALVSLFMKTQGWRPDPKLGCEKLTLKLYCLVGSMLVTNRQNLIAAALKDGCTHVLFIDDDMIFPPDSLIRLLLRNKSVIAANCVTRNFPVRWIAHDLKSKELSSSGKTGVQKVQHVGAAFMLIRREVLEPLTLPLFMMEWIPSLQAHCGEDIYFCMKLQAEASADIWVDHDLSQQISHIGKLPHHAGLIGVELPKLKTM